MRRAVVAAALALAGCTLITNPGRVRFDADGSTPSMDAGPDAMRPDGALPDGARPDGGGGPAVCGDGVVQDGEACDDGATTDCGDCNADCSGPGTGSTCGDGAICADTEACDDGAAADGDGCSSACAIETGFSCSGEPSVCSAGCGDGSVVAPEACDDGGNADGDGCDAACAVELGWDCASGACVPICGDGFVVGAEACDDRNDQACGTCNETCDGPGTGRCPSGTGCVRGLDCERGLCDEGSCGPSCVGRTCDDPALPYCENGVCNECDVFSGAGCADPTPYCGGTGGVGFECVECADGAHCPADRPICDFGTCRGCVAFAECGGGGFDCCDGACVFTSTDPMHCGSCGTVCAIDESCMFGGCCAPAGEPCVTDSSCCSGTCGSGVCS